MNRIIDPVHFHPVGSNEYDDNLIIGLLFPVQDKGE